MSLFMHLGTQYCTPREIRHCLFNAALRALLNRQWLISRVVQYSCLMHSHLINYSFNMNVCMYIWALPLALFLVDK